MTTEKTTRSKKVNEGVKAAPKKVNTAAKTTTELAKEVMRGMHGTGRDRMRSLGNRYADVQQEVTRLSRTK